MKEFEKYKKRAEVKTIGYLNNRAAFDAGRETGWKAALGFIQSLYDKYELEDWSYIACTIEGDVNKELSDK